MKKNFFITFLFVCCIHTFAGAQNLAPAFNSIEDAYRKFEFDRVDSLANAALSVYKNYSKKELIWIHLYLGSAKFAQGYKTAAGEQFAAALSLNPDLELDSAFFSPKIIQLFQEIKSEQTTFTDKQKPKFIRYIMQPDRRVNASWRSLLVPGWGQLYKDEKKKAKILMLISALTVTSAAVSHWKMIRAHDQYLAAREPAQIENRFSSYKNWYRVRNGFILFGILNWSYAYFDALLKPVPQESFSWQMSGSLSDSQSFQLSLKLNF